jgi:hypothetical protein
MSDELVTLEGGAVTVARGALNRDELIALIGDDIYDTNEQFADRILALVEPETPFLPSQGKEQADAWEAVAAHPAVQSCYEEERPLLESVLALLDRYEKLDDVDQRVREEQARETAKAVLDRVWSYGNSDFNALRDIGRSFGVQFEGDS